jgi:hypothetical protein
MAVIRCKLTKNGKSIASAEIHFGSGDKIHFEAGQKPHFDEGSSVPVLVGEATLHVCVKHLGDSADLVVGPEIPPGAAPTDPTLPPNPKNPPPKHKGTAAG